MILDSNEIEKIIPHRYPFLLVDKIIEIDDAENRIVGIKNVTANEPFFQGHFPGLHIMPGVLIIEALAQTGAVAMLSKEEFRGKVAILAGLEKCRFRHQVKPSDTLRLEVTLTKIRGPIGKGIAKAYVGETLAANMEMTFAIG
ncbi:beta-hydroxyacyl-ACP dehydratase [endosymbiont 'TC1' of Trimyema compressum]|uniref:3-hydroxyacyl-ACP dehydratase FabZ n=1 Tax=endosymbiont 'TC1' of Trimyema compressum TaxID=243899 RepID=UPI0007F05D7E|nr:3-hydroxyacyl-ACP dehydratase FabZ [endosymbiont 'TC1' of Trimyema compressum]AMP21275.1 beta-hydroxyacyl-ACP dehydratase [endosymbiont 'TC1' of Trimyema compressum]